MSMELHSIGALRIVSQHQGRAWLTVSQHQGRAMLSVSEGWADTSMRAPSSCLPASHSTSPPPHSPPPSFSSRETHLISFSSSPPWRRLISRSYDLHWLRLLSLSSSLTNYLPLTKNNTRKENTILGQLKMGEHQAKYRALYLTNVNIFL